MSRVLSMRLDTCLAKIHLNSYIVHSAFAIICPIHFLYLTFTSSDSPRSIYRGLHLALSEQISATRFDRPLSFPTWGFIRLSTILAISVAIPALLWFIAVTLAPCVYLRCTYKRDLICHQAVRRYCPMEHERILRLSAYSQTFWHEVGTASIGCRSSCYRRRCGSSVREQHLLGRECKS